MVVNGGYWTLLMVVKWWLTGSIMSMKTTMNNQKNHYIITIWLVVFRPTPLKNDGVRQWEG
jgi:hypothetical protein